MRKGFIITNSPLHIKSNYIYLFNWDDVNEVENINTDTFLPREKLYCCVGCWRKKVLSLFLILLPLLSFAQSDTLCLTPQQRDKVYEGLKRYEFYKVEFPKALNAVKELQGIIVAQDSTLQSYLNREEQRYNELRNLYEERQKQAVTRAEIKSSKWGFWDWVLYLGSVAAGTYLGIQIGN